MQPAAIYRNYCKHVVCRCIDNRIITAQSLSGLETANGLRFFCVMQVHGPLAVYRAERGLRLPAVQRVPVNSPDEGQVYVSRFRTQTLTNKRQVHLLFERQVYNTTDCSAWTCTFWLRRAEICALPSNLPGIKTRRGCVLVIRVCESVSCTPQQDYHAGISVTLADTSTCSRWTISTCNIKPKKLTGSPSSTCVVFIAVNGVQIWGS